MSDNEYKSVVESARAEMLAAYAIAGDPECPPAMAAGHVVRAWELLHVAVEGGDPPQEIAELAKWVATKTASATAVAPWIEEVGRIVRSWPHDPATIRLGTEGLEKQLEALRDVLQAELRRRGLVPPLRTRAQLWARRAAVWGGVTVAFLLVALRPWEWTGIGPWRGAYYPAEDFRGEPEVRRDADVSFDWGLEPPTDSIPSDRFGARWDTCLVLDQAEPAAFQLVADDGARLYVDGELVVDMWKTEEPPGARGAKIDLEPGVYHLRVEYWEDDEEAQVHLLATFDEDVPPGPLPARLLEYPGEELDEEDPCGEVSR